MSIDISALDRAMPKVVRHFWKSRLLAARNQKQRGVADQGNRSGVTAGKTWTVLSRSILRRQQHGHGAVECMQELLQFLHGKPPLLYRQNPAWSFDV